MLLQVNIELDIDELFLTEDEIDQILEDLLLSLPRSFRIDEDDYIIVNGSKILDFKKYNIEKG